MKSKHSLYLVLSLLLAMPLFAAGAPAATFQGGQGGGQGGGRRAPMTVDERLAQMTKDYNLTADQQAKIKPILEADQKKSDALRADTTVDRATMRTKMMDNQKETNTKVRALLDAKQKDMFDKAEADRQARMQGGRQGGGGGNMGGGGQ